MYKVGEPVVEAASANVSAYLNITIPDPPLPPLPEDPELLPNPAPPAPPPQPVLAVAEPPGPNAP